MAGITNDILNADNVNFSGQNSTIGEVTTDGQLLIGSSVAPNIRVNTLTAGAGVSITNGEGSITIGLSGGSIGIDSINVQASTPPGTDPVLPNGAGLMTVNGAAVANHSVVLEAVSRAANTYNLEVQYAAAAAATDATKSGVSHFNSAQFTVDANGFVSTSGSAAFPWSDTSGAVAAVSFNGYFITATCTSTLPASPSQGDTISYCVDTTDILTITANTGQRIRLGTSLSISGGTCASTARGDSITLVYRTTGATWFSVPGPQGNWNVQTS